MKVICDRPALLDAVNRVSGVVATRTPRPQLTCVKLTAVKKDGVGTLTLAATDGEVALRLTTAQVDVQEEGEALAPADKLRQIVSSADLDSTLTIEAERDACQIKGADARFKILGFPPSEFPKVAVFPEDAPTITLSAGKLSGLISRTIFATARETSRYAINGVLLKRNGKKLEMVATDGRRLALARSTIDASSGGDEQATCIIPTKALNQALRLIDDLNQPVRIAITETQAIFAFGAEGEPGGAVLATNLVEGAFPPYEDVVPKDHDKRATFDRNALTSGVRRAALLTNEESRGVRLAIDSEKLRLSSRAPELGEAEIDVPVTSYEGEPIEIGFNPTFVIDALKVIDEDEATLELKAPNKPGLLRIGTDFLYVVMPVNLQ